LAIAKSAAKPKKHLGRSTGSKPAPTRTGAHGSNFTGLDSLAFPLGRVAAAEAGAIDPRVVAVANLDGWLSGRAAFGALYKPSLVILGKNAVFTGARQLQSPNPNNLLKHDSEDG
jgi:hypothetical protein